MVADPKTLQEAVVFFADPDNCINYLAARRWKDGKAACPTCGSENVSYLGSRRVWQCKTRHPKAQFSIKVGTIFEDSAVPLDKWLLAMWMIANCKNGVSSYEIHRSTGVSQKTAWFMLQRIRLAMQDENTGGKIGGNGGGVEVDETLIGGKARNMHKARRDRMMNGAKAGPVGKTIIQGMLERGGKVHFTVMGHRALGAELAANVRQHVEPGTQVYTDESHAYQALGTDYAHEFVNHAEEYVRGNVHTNGLESFWSMLKRGLNGTYISVEPFHLFRYVDEQAFRFNHRKDMTDGDRFHALCSRIVGKRLTFAEVTGKVSPTPED